MPTIRRLVGVFDADGSIRGEVAYAVGKALGRRHCALCDITHGWSPVERRSFRTCRAGLPVPFDLVHRDERTPAIEAATQEGLPRILAETEAAFVSLLGPAELAALRAGAEELVSALEHAVREADLAWPAAGA
jgi:hypothetical protein